MRWLVLCWYPFILSTFFMLSITLGRRCSGIQTWAIHWYRYLPLASGCMYVKVFLFASCATFWSQTYCTVLTLSAGARGCIGFRFAMTESVCILALLVRQYGILVLSDFESCSKAEQGDVLLKWTTGVTITPTNSRVRLRRRSWFLWRVFDLQESWDHEL